MLDNRVSRIIQVEHPTYVISWLGQLVSVDLLSFIIPVEISDQLVGC
jgi:hypothetical protein